MPNLFLFIHHMRQQSLIRFFLTILFTIFIAFTFDGKPSAHADEPDDTSQFVTGVSSFHSGKYGTATKIVEELLEKHPETPLRDLALALLSRSYLKLGKKDIAASFAARLLKEYPSTPLGNQLEKELVASAQNLVKQKPETVASARPSAPQSPQPPVTKPLEHKLTEKQKPDRTRLAQLTPKERPAQEQTEKERLLKATAEKEGIAKEKAEKERLAKEQAERERLAKLQAEEERIAKENAEQERLAREQAERERLAKLKAEEERIAKEKAEQERQAREQAEHGRLARLKAEEERIAKENVEQERLAREQAERERLAKLKAEEERISQNKAEKERLTKEQEKELAGRQRLTLATPVIPPAASQSSTGVPQLSDDAAFHLEVQNEIVAPVGTEVPIAVVVSNTGKEVPTLSWHAPSSVRIRAMDPLRRAGGEAASGTVGLLIPVAIDGSRYHVTMKAATWGGKEAVTNVTVIASSPLLRVVARGTKKLALPGEMVEFRIVVLNAGSLAAEGAELTIDLPQHVEIVNPGALVVKSRDRLENRELKIKPGEAREFPVRIRIAGFAVKGQEIRLSGTLTSSQGEQKFSSPPVIVRLAD